MNCDNVSRIKPIGLVDASTHESLSEIYLSGAIQRRNAPHDARMVTDHAEGTRQWGAWCTGYLLAMGIDTSLGDMERVHGLADEFGFTRPSWETLPITLDFTLSHEQAKMARAACYDLFKKPDDIGDVRDRFRWDAGQTLAHRNSSHIKCPRHRIPVSLNDVTVTAVEFSQGDDPTLTRAENRAALRRCIERFISTSANVHPYEYWRSDRKKRDHYKRLLEIYDRVAENRGFQPVRNHWHPAKTNVFVPVTEIVVGDTLEWTYNTFGHYGAHRIANNEWLVDVVAEKYLPNKDLFDPNPGNRRWLSVVVTRSGIDEAVCSLTPAKFTESSLISDGSHARRRLWRDESARNVLVEESRALRARHGVDVPVMPEPGRTYPATDDVATAHDLTGNVSRPKPGIADRSVSGAHHDAVAGGALSDTATDANRRVA